MDAIPVLAALLLGLAATLAGQPAAAEPVAPEGGAGEGAAKSSGSGDDAVRGASQAVADLRTRLGKALRGALAEGPEHAIEVCRVEAPRIAADVASRGMRVGRTSERLRNPANAPEPWMEPLLAALAAEPAPARPRTVDLGARGTGYVEPIYVAPLCTTCHGDAIAPGLLEAIRERYPEDRATGYAAGDFRGLFWAVVAPGTTL